MSCICTGPESCGISGVTLRPEDCSVCGSHGIMVIARCGAFRCTHVHPLDVRPMAPRRVEPAPAAPAAADPDDKPLRLLKMLETSHAPTRKVGNVLKPPVLCPALPGITGVVHVVAGYAWKRPHRGKTIRLDRTAAFLSAAASVRVAHGPLEHTGALNAFDRNRAGYYLITAHRWAWDHMPNPLGNPRAPEIWVPAPTLQLLVALADQDRWADVDILDSYTAAGVPLTTWTNSVKAIRASIVGKYGRDSKSYDDFKVAYSQAITLMIGSDNPGHGRRWKCKAQRPDWTHAIHAQAAANMWRSADSCAAAGAMPVALVNIDELHLEESARPMIEQIITGERVGPIKMDPDGIKLGTFKVKP